MKTVINHLVTKSKVLLIFLILLVLFENLTANDNAKDEKNYSFNYDQEIPTLIKYGSKISGCFSHTAYIGTINSVNSKIRTSIDIGYNVTEYDLEPPMSMGRAFSIGGFGFIPLYPDYYVLSSHTQQSIQMFSPFAGCSYSIRSNEWFGIDVLINAGPVYVKRIKFYNNESEAENDDVDYYDYLEATEAMHDVPGHWGGRFNPKLKIYYIFSAEDCFSLGLNIGYTQFVFLHNNFNSYDIGINFSFIF